MSGAIISWRWRCPSRQNSPYKSQRTTFKSAFGDPTRTKLFHFARFDVAVLEHNIGPIAGDIYCTKIASKLARTYTDRHGLRDLCPNYWELIIQTTQSSDWAPTVLRMIRLIMPCDVLYLHQIRTRLDSMLEREARQNLAVACFAFIRTRTALDLDLLQI